MARPDWLRTFVAIYRSGSVTDGARLRSLSQPAASQQLAGLERVIGSPLFVRVAEGVVPTERGRALYADVASALDQLEVVLSGLDAGQVDDSGAAVRVGSSAELFSAQVIPQVVETDLSVVARFGEDDELIDGLERGELDVAFTSCTPPRRSLSAVPIGEKRFVLVAAPSLAPQFELSSMPELGSWLSGRHWVAYSLELPITRRFWQTHLGRPFSARLRLVVPDLRAVVGAVERGLGCSILPLFVCRDLLDQGRIVEVHPVSELIPPEPWYLCFRQGEATRPAVARLVQAFALPPR
ncbi:MAG TPA: LysR family transcriptional regulator [Acidimicrobiales bacterium]|nr:LysR family transcriptional regulator [Acidimicrobiales bacterium]